MIKPRSFLFGILLLVNSALSAQVRQFAFKVEELLDNNATRTASNIEILFDGLRQKAGPDGMINFTPAINRKEVAVSMPDQRQYIIIGSATIPLPEDPGLGITITIRKPTQKEQAILQVGRDLKKLDIKIDQLDSIRKNDYAQYLEMTRMMDSVYQIVTRQFRISESDLRSATEKMRGRDKYFVIISSSLESYLNEAKDIRDIFKTMLDFSLENPRSFRLFDSTIRVYNKAYNDLNGNNDEYEKAVANFWDSDDLSLGFHNVFDFAINDTHRAGIIPLNAQLIPRANSYIHERSKSRRKALKVEITAILNTVIPVLDNNLPILENKIRYYLGKLESQKNVYTH
jgi:hypothetical protein